jgi:ubiquinone/menaquinone biosynthesis C-methylase UbiE
MLDRTRARALAANVADRVAVTLGDAHQLPFVAETFDLVVALGVLPWLHSPSTAIEEIARVLKPGSYLVASADNRSDVARFVDPLRNPALSPLKDRVNEALRRLRVRQPLPSPNKPSSLREIDAQLGRVGLERVRSSTIGFGPFTFFRRPLLSDRVHVRLDDLLQRLADRGVPAVRSAGAQHVFLARRRSVPNRASGSS